MKTGILLMNTGTPDAPTVEAIRPYLTEFLMDPAIIGAPGFVRKPLVQHIVNRRPERTVAHYQAFWTPEGSPFMIVSEAQRDALQAALDGPVAGAPSVGEQVAGEQGANEQVAGTQFAGAPGADGQAAGTQAATYQVELAMRYGSPSIRTGLEKLRAGACQRVVLVPFYPQNVNVCAGTCLKEAHDQLAELARTGWHPEALAVESFHDQPAYRDALAQQVAAHWTYKPGAKLMVSFHSTMMADIRKDPTYLQQATQTKDWLASALGVPAQDATLSFQSRFDSRKWLSPFTEQLLQQLIDGGATDICVVCPGFVADNIETMIEVNEDLRSKAARRVAPGHVSQDRAEVMAEAADSVNFTYVPALGTHPGLIQAVATAIREAEAAAQS